MPYQYFMQWCALALSCVIAYIKFNTLDPDWSWFIMHFIAGITTGLLLNTLAKAVVALIASYQYKKLVAFGTPQSVEQYIVYMHKLKSVNFSLARTTISLPIMLFMLYYCWVYPESISTIIGFLFGEVSFYGCYLYLLKPKKKTCNCFA